MSVIRHKVLGDHRGQLVAIEGNNDILFDIKRVFYIYGTQKDVSRGNHAHYKTKQYLITVNGSCRVTLDNGKIPDDIPEDANDSALEKQIRRAAIKAKDPEKKKRLWNEYRKYKGLDIRD